MDSSQLMASDRGTPIAKSLGRRTISRPIGSIWRFYFERGKLLLEDLASLKKDCSQFRRKWDRMFLRGETDEDLLTLRDELQAAWERGPQELDALASRLAYRKYRGQEYGKVKWHKFTLRNGDHISVPIFFDLPRALSLAILELSPRLACCANPGCFQLYFLKGRSKQRFCDVPACAQFGQRQHKLKWWRQHGRARQTRSKTKRPRKKPETFLKQPKSSDRQ